MVDSGVIYDAFINEVADISKDLLVRKHGNRSKDDWAIEIESGFSLSLRQYGHVIATVEVVEERGGYGYTDEIVVCYVLGKMEDDRYFKLEDPDLMDRVTERLVELLDRGMVAIAGAKEAARSRLIKDGN